MAAGSLVRQQPDAGIAAILNRCGKRTGRGNTWTEGRARSHRSAHGNPDRSEWNDSVLYKLKMVVCGFGDFAKDMSPGLIAGGCRVISETERHAILAGIIYQIA